MSVLTGFTLSSFIVITLLAITIRYRRPSKLPAPLVQTSRPEPRIGQEKNTVKVQEDDIFRGILVADEHRLSRGGWVTRLGNHVYNIRHGGRFNVLVINTELERYFIPEDVIETFEALYQSSKARRTVRYEVTVFRHGHLINLGDGGQINWFFGGNFEKIGMTVDFRPIPKKQV